MTRRPHWSILRVDPRMVRRVVEALTEQGLMAYAPMETYEQKRRVVRAGRERIAYVTKVRPLLGPYVFALIQTDRDLNIARGNRAVLEVMAREGRPLCVPAAEVGAFVLAEACHEFDPTWKPPKRRTPKVGGRRPSVRESRWKVGQEVAFKRDHALSGIAGLIMNTDRGSRIRLLVELFGRVTEVEANENEVVLAA